MSIRKKTAGLIAVCMVFSLMLTACDNSPENSGPETSGPTAVINRPTYFALAFPKSGGTNPYLSNDTVTYQNATLLYTRLVTFSPEFELEYLLAQNVVNEGTTVTVILGTAHFADGATITAQDVVASLQKAMGSGAYGGRFGNIASVDVSGNTIIITLKKPDALFAYLLDFPILKASEVDILFPMGSGRYTYSETANGEAIFVANPHYAGALPIGTINLLKLSGQDVLISSLNMGNVSFYASETGQTAGGNASNTAYFGTNHFVFIGLNSNSAILQDANVRAAISMAINRNAICEKSYYSRAYPATSVLNPLYPVASASTAFSPTADEDMARQLLASAGYTVSELDGIATNESGGRLTLRLLVCTQSPGKRFTATLIKEQLARVGISVTIIETDSFETYNAMLTDGNFDMYLGEVKLLNNLDLSPFLEGATSYGITPTEDLINAYNAFLLSGHSAELTAQNFATFESAFTTHTPYVPLLYCYGTVAYNRNLQGVNPSLSDVFYTFENLTADE